MTMTLQASPPPDIAPLPSLDSGLAGLALIAGYYRIAAEPTQLRHQLALSGRLAGAEDLVRGESAKISDSGWGLRVRIGSSARTNVISGFTVEGGGYGSVTQSVNSFHAHGNASFRCGPQGGGMGRRVRHAAKLATGVTFAAAKPQHKTTTIWQALSQRRFLHPIPLTNPPTILEITAVQD